MADKHPHIPEELRTDPDLHLFHTRMSVALTPGSQAAIQPFLAKEKLVLMKNEAILTCFAPIPGRSLFLLYN